MRSLFSAVILLLLPTAACGAGSRAVTLSAPRATVGVTDRSVLVIAPHPDDEVLMAAGAVRRALQTGAHVHVVIVTNGDYTCTRDGWARQGESVRALAELGLGEQDVTFLGYPDGYLSALGASSLEPVERRAIDGRCDRASGTYANRGLGAVDEHRRRTGHAGEYTYQNAVDDLAAVLRRVAPTDVYVTHPMDDHPDHAATYGLFRDALESLRDREWVRAIRSHRAIVHAGPCWPNGSSQREPCSSRPLRLDLAMPPLPEPFGEYLANERVDLGDLARSGRSGAALKLHAIVQYSTQLGPRPEDDWLVSFARRDEAFYVERLEFVSDAPRRWMRSRASGIVSGAGACGGYDLTRSDGRVALRGGSGVLRSWPVPFGEDSLNATFTIGIDPRPDDGPNVVEVTVELGRRWLGQVIDLQSVRDCRTTRRRWSAELLSGGGR